MFCNPVALVKSQLLRYAHGALYGGGAVAKIRRCWAGRLSGVCAHIYAELLPHTKLRAIACNGAWMLQLHNAAGLAVCTNCIRLMSAGGGGRVCVCCACERDNRVCCADEHCNRIGSDQKRRRSQRMCFLLKIRRHHTRIYLRIFVHNDGDFIAEHPFYMRSIVSLPPAPEIVHCEFAGA